MKQIVMNVLNDSRNTGRRIDLDSASALLRWMHATPRDADVAEVQTCCLLLLGQWVNGELYRPLSELLALPPCCSVFDQYQWRVILSDGDAACLKASSILLRKSYLY